MNNKSSIKFEGEPMTKEEIKKENEIVFTGSINEAEKYILDYIESIDRKLFKKRCKHCNHPLKEFGNTRKRLECVNYLCVNYKNIHSYKK